MKSRQHFQRSKLIFLVLIIIPSRVRMGNEQLEFLSMFLCIEKGTCTISIVLRFGEPYFWLYSFLLSMLTCLYNAKTKNILIMFFSLFHISTTYYGYKQKHR